MLILREGLKNIQRGGGVPILRPSGAGCWPPPFSADPIWTPPKMQVLSVHPPQIDCAGENFEKKFFWNHPKKAKKLQIYSIIRPYLMKNVDPPPILATLLSKQKTPPHIPVKFKETPPKLVEFHIHSPQNRWKWSTPPQKNVHPPPLDVFDIFPNLSHLNLDFHGIKDKISRLN